MTQSTKTNLTLDEMIRLIDEKKKKVIMYGAKLAPKLQDDDLFECYQNAVIKFHTYYPDDGLSSQEGINIFIYWMKKTILQYIRDNERSKICYLGRSFDLNEFEGGTVFDFNNRPSNHISPHQSAATSELYGLVIDCVSQLDGLSKYIFIEKAVYGKSPQELGTELGLSGNAVCMRYTRVKLTLQKKLQATYDAC